MAVTRWFGFYLVLILGSIKEVAPFTSCADDAVSLITLERSQWSYVEPADAAGSPDTPAAAAADPSFLQVSAGDHRHDETNLRLFVRDPHGKDWRVEVDSLQPLGDVVAAVSQRIGIHQAAASLQLGDRKVQPSLTAARLGLANGDILNLQYKAAETAHSPPPPPPPPPAAAAEPGEEVHGKRPAVAKELEDRLRGEVGQEEEEEDADLRGKSAKRPQKAANRAAKKPANQRGRPARKAPKQSQIQTPTNTTPEAGTVQPTQQPQAQPSQQPEAAAASVAEPPPSPTAISQAPPKVVATPEPVAAVPAPPPPTPSPGADLDAQSDQATAPAPYPSPAQPYNSWLDGPGNPYYLAPLQANSTSGRSNSTVPIMMEPLKNLSKSEMQAIAATRSKAALDCVLSDWSEWADCRKYKDDGMRVRYTKRFRQVLQPPRPGGRLCPADLVSSRACLSRGTLMEIRGMTDLLYWPVDLVDRLLTTEGLGRSWT